MIHLGEIDNLIKAGKIAEAQDRIGAIVISHMPRNKYAEFAALARRAGLPSTALKLLNPIIRPESPLTQPASAQESVEYGIALIKVGSISEGRAVLAEEVKKENPQALYFHSLSYFPEWDYESGANGLEAYLKSFDLPEYQRLVAGVNLCAAYAVLDRSLEATELIERLLAESRRNNYRLLMGNLLELSAQVNIRTEHFEDAERALAEASELLAGAPVADSLYISKWRSIANLLRSPTSKEAFESLQVARDAAVQFGHWETVRDLDFHVAVARQDAGMFHHLYFGTPFAAYRTRLVSRLPKIQIENQYDWKLLEGIGPVIDSVEGKLPNGKLLSGLFLELATDFYRPLSTASEKFWKVVDG